MSRPTNISILRLFFLTILALCLFPSMSQAQEVSDVDFTVAGSTVTITYNITACSSNEDYDVRLFLGQNSELSEIKTGLSGDLEHVSCGSSNTIVWDALSDREELKGPVFFAVEILRTHAVVTDESPIAYTDDESGPAGAVPNGDPANDQVQNYRPRQNAYFPPISFFQLGVRIVVEQARAGILSHGRPTVVFQKSSGAGSSHSSPQRTRRR